MIRKPTSLAGDVKSAVVHVGRWVVYQSGVSPSRPGWVEPARLIFSESLPAAHAVRPRPARAGRA